VRTARRPDKTATRIAAERRDETAPQLEDELEDLQLDDLADRTEIDDRTEVCAVHEAAFPVEPPSAPPAAAPTREPRPAPLRPISGRTASRSPGAAVGRASAARSGAISARTTKPLDPALAAQIALAVGVSKDPIAKPAEGSDVDDARPPTVPPVLSTPAFAGPPTAPPATAPTPLPVAPLPPVTTSTVLPVLSVPSAPSLGPLSPPPSSPGPQGPRRSIEEFWPEPTSRKRRFPDRVRLIGGAAIVLLVLVIAFGQRGGPKLETRVVTPLDDEMVVSADELKNRKEVRADQFRVPGARPVAASAPPSAPAEATADPAPATTPESLAERRARRHADPNDVLTLKKNRAGGTEAKAKRGPAAGADDLLYDGPVYVGPGGTAVGSSPSGEPTPATAAAAPSAERGAAQRLAAAGSALPARLVSPIDLRGSSGTVVAQVSAQGPLQRARLIGTASARDGRITLRFNNLILAEGRQVRVNAEAQDADGAFGLAYGDGSSSSDDDNATGAVLSGTAEDTASDLVSSTIGGSIAGRTVDRLMTGSSRVRRGGDRGVKPASLPAGTKFQVFLHEAVELGR
jgi:hypothetical protein